MGNFLIFKKISNFQIKKKAICHWDFQIFHFSRQEFHLLFAHFSRFFRDLLLCGAPTRNAPKKGKMKLFHGPGGQKDTDTHTYPSMSSSSFPSSSLFWTKSRETKFLFGFSGFLAFFCRYPCSFSSHFHANLTCFWHFSPGVVIWNNSGSLAEQPTPHSTLPRGAVIREVMKFMWKPPEWVREPTLIGFGALKPRYQLSGSLSIPRDLNYWIIFQVLRAWTPYLSVIRNPNL